MATHNQDDNEHDDDLEIVFEPETIDIFEDARPTREIRGGFQGDPSEIEDYGDDAGEDDSLDPADAGNAFSPDLRPVVQIISRADLDAAIEADAITGEGEAASSSEQANRLASLRGLRTTRQSLLRKPILVADDATIDRLHWVGRRAPNVNRVVDIAINAATLSAKTATPLKLPAPLLVVGPPAAGKTRVARLIGEAMGMTVEVVEGSSIPDAGPITGYNVSWKGARQGCIARSILSSDTTGAMIIIDEVDKAEFDRRHHPWDILLPVLEQDTAAVYKDEYWAVPMRADLVSFVFCTNSLHTLSEPFLDRCLIVEVEPLEGDQMRLAMERVVDAVLTAHRLPLADLDPAALDALCVLGFRRARAVVTIALGRALGEGRCWPDPDDIEAAIRQLSSPRKTVKIGFLP